MEMGCRIVLKMPKNMAYNKLVWRKLLDIWKRFQKRLDKWLLFA